MRLEGLLLREHALAGAALAVVVALSWAYLLAGAGMAMPRPEWTAGYFGVMFAMWAVMMVAMMLPSAAPMILLYLKIARQGESRGGAQRATGLFVLGYVAVWTTFSLGTTAAQWGLDTQSLLSPMMDAASRTLAGALLVAAGIYQLTPLKQSCLRRCRSPLDFVMTHWRAGAAGAFDMGVRHGAYCVGCCWGLMLLLFVGGVMSLAWIAGIAALVLIEKVVRGGPWLARIAGAALVAWGSAVLLGVSAP